MVDTLNIGGEGGNSFPFDRIGAQVSGQIIDMAEVQQTDLKTGELKFFDSGQPMMMYRVTLQTQLRDPANPQDDGKRSIYLKGSRKPETQSSLSAVVGAVQQATGSTDLQVGGSLTLQYTGDGPAQRGFTAPKLYAAAYQPPSLSLGQPAAQPQGNAWDGAVQQAPPPAPPQQQAVQPPAPAPVAQPPVQQPAAQVGPEQAAALAQLGITPEQLAALAAQNQAAAAS